MCLISGSLEPCYPALHMGDRSLYLFPTPRPLKGAYQFVYIPLHTFRDHTSIPHFSTCSILYFFLITIYYTYVGGCRDNEHDNEGICGICPGAQHIRLCSRGCRKRGVTSHPDISRVCYPDRWAQLRWTLTLSGEIPA